jgi:hypothetical protein
LLRDALVLHLCQQQDEIKIAPDFFRRDLVQELLDGPLHARSGLSFLRVRRLFARCF